MMEILIALAGGEINGMIASLGNGNNDSFGKQMEK